MVLTSAKQPFTTGKKTPELNKVILNRNLLQIQLTIFEMNCLFQTHRCVHHILSLGKILQCFWWAVIAIFTAADRDAFLLKVLCIVPVCVIIHPAAVQLKAKSHNNKKWKQSYVVDSPFEKTPSAMRATWFMESAPVRSALSRPLKCFHINKSPLVCTEKQSHKCNATRVMENLPLTFLWMVSTGFLLSVLV